MKASLPAPETIPALSNETLAYDVKGLMKATGWRRWKIQEDIAAGRLIARKGAGKLIILRDDAMAWLTAMPIREPNK